MHQPSRRSTLMGLGLDAAGIFTSALPASAATETKPGTTTTTTGPAPAPTPIHPSRFGLTNAGGPLASKELNRAASLAGKPFLLASTDSRLTVAVVGGPSGGILFHDAGTAACRPHPSTLPRTCRPPAIGPNRGHRTCCSDNRYKTAGRPSQAHHRPGQ